MHAFLHYLPSVLSLLNYAVANAYWRYQRDIWTREHLPEGETGWGTTVCEGTIPDWRHQHDTDTEVQTTA